MCYKIVDHISLKNFFSLICTSLTLYLVYQELYTFSISRPTTISTETGIFEKDDLPELVICSEPGLDIKAVEKYGYRMDKYYRGSYDGQKFVGWNGVKKDKSSNQILEELLTIKNTSILRLDEEYGFLENLSTYVAPNISLRKLMYPHGSIHAKNV